MLSYTNKIQKTAKKILENKIVDGVIGYKKGTIPFINEPCYLTNSNNVDLLIWDSNCRINLVKYITNNRKKIGIITKGCDSRNIITHILENKIKRENIYIIGVPCTGMIDKNKIISMINDKIINIIEEDNNIRIITKNDNLIINKKEILQDNCKVCSNQNPVISDEIITDKIENKKHSDPYNLLTKIDSMSYDARWNYFNKMFSECIRCYACRNACPLCYCPVCFVDESSPQWVGKGQNISDIITFHFMRAYHCAGRCTDCGACEQACPVGINMRILTKMLERDCKELFNWESGISLNERPILDTYSLNDPNEFIK